MKNKLSETECPFNNRISPDIIIELTQYAFSNAIKYKYGSRTQDITDKCSLYINLQYGSIAVFYIVYIFFFQYTL